MNKKRATKKDTAKLLAERQAAFKRVVEPRVAKAIKAIQLIGNCAGAGYSYEPAQVKQIMSALTTAANNVFDKFSKVKDKQTEFKLQDTE